MSCFINNGQRRYTLQVNKKPSKVECLGVSITTNTFIPKGGDDDFERVSTAAPPATTTEEEEEGGGGEVETPPSNRTSHNIEFNNIVDNEFEVFEPVHRSRRVATRQASRNLNNTTVAKRSRRKNQHKQKFCVQNEMNCPLFELVHELCHFIIVEQEKYGDEKSEKKSKTKTTTLQEYINAYYDSMEKQDVKPSALGYGINMDVIRGAITEVFKPGDIIESISTPDMYDKELKKINKYLRESPTDEAFSEITQFFTDLFGGNKSDEKDYSKYFPLRIHFLRPREPYVAPAPISIDNATAVSCLDSSSAAIDVTDNDTSKINTVASASITSPVKSRKRKYEGNHVVNNTDMIEANDRLLASQLASGTDVMDYSCYHQGDSDYDANTQSSGSDDEYSPDEKKSKSKKKEKIKKKASKSKTKKEEEKAEPEILVIDILSSDDEDDTKENKPNNETGDNGVAQAADGQLAVSNVDSTILLGSTSDADENMTKPITVIDCENEGILDVKAFPDPKPTYELDDWVQTPIGPGKIVSCRVDRFTESDTFILKPILIYTVDLALQFSITSTQSIHQLSASSKTFQKRSTQIHVPYNLLQPYESTIDSTKLVLKWNSSIDPTNKSAKNDITLLRKDVLRLTPQTYLNDSIINFFLKFTVLQYTTLNENNKLDFYVFPTYFYTRISDYEGGGNVYKSKTQKDRLSFYEQIKGWTKNVSKILEKQFLIFPINYQHHWSFVLVCHPGVVLEEQNKQMNNAIISQTDMAIDVDDDENTSAAAAAATNTRNGSDLAACMLHFDSGKFLRFHRSATIFNVIRRYLSAYFEGMKDQDTKPTESVPVELIETEPEEEQQQMFNGKNMPGFSPNIVQQQNMKDCGVYMLEFIDRILSNPPSINQDFVDNKGCIVPPDSSSESPQVPSDVCSSVVENDKNTSSKKKKTKKKQQPLLIDFDECAILEKRRNILGIIYSLGEAQRKPTG